MKRRNFLSLLATACLTPPLPAREVLEQFLPTSLPPPQLIKLHVIENIGFTVCNSKALQKVVFAAEMPNNPRDILRP